MDINLQINEMVLNYIILLVVLSIIIEAKKIFHWKYLTTFDSSLKNYKSLKHFKRSKDLNIQNQFWEWTFTNFKLL
ncbi:MAG: hypothetical protein ACFCUU_19040, partial [Cyclobacteriaceae bacterium]